MPFSINVRFKSFLHQTNSWKGRYAYVNSECREADALKGMFEFSTLICLESLVILSVEKAPLSESNRGPSIEK